MATGIIGAGFGLYGYLPAVLHCEKQVILTERARGKFSSRKELEQFSDQIVWVNDVDELLEIVDTLVISTAPDIQKKLVSRSVLRKNIKNFVLEKPLASNARDANVIINLLEKHDKNFRINYSFFYSIWFKNLECIFLDESRNRNLDLDIVWNFKAHHYANNLSNWKRFSSQGGGVINFFAIHLIAVIARLNFIRIISSEVKGFNTDDIFYFSAVVNNENANVCNIRVNADSESNLFKITLRESNSSIEENILFESESPFEEILENKELLDLDIRVPLIYQLLKEVKEQTINDDLISLYKSINEMWSEFEKQANTIL